MTLDREIESLNQKLLKMCDIVIKNLRTAFSAYKKETELEVIDDDLVNRYERLIEELCLDILVRERPYSRDLRVISGVLKLVSDLERIGDHAEDVMEYATKLKNDKNKTRPEVEQMIEICLNMVVDSIFSYTKMDIAKANSVINMDDIIDEMYAEVVEDLIRESSSKPSYAIYTTLVVKYIERICDHAVNIAEWVIYIISGYYKDAQIF